MYLLLPDVYLTRRQRLHYVLNHAGDLAWSGKAILSALEFLAAADQTEFEIEAQDRENGFRVEIKAGWTKPTEPE